MECVLRFNRVAIHFPDKIKNLECLDGNVFTVHGFIIQDLARIIIVKFADARQILVNRKILYNLSEAEILRLAELARKRKLKIVFKENNLSRYAFFLSSESGIHQSVCLLFNYCLWRDKYCPSEIDDFSA